MSWAKREDMTRIVLDILRQASEPLTTRDIAFELLTQWALNRDDKRLLRLMRKRVGWRLGVAGEGGWCSRRKGRDSLGCGRSGAEN